MSYGPDTVERVIPHRHPIRLVDHLRDVEPGRSLTAVTEAATYRPAHERLVAEHGTDGATVPPGLLLESLLQAAAVLHFWDAPNPDVAGGRVELAVGMSGVALHRPVRVGERVEHHVEVVRVLDDATTLTGRSTSGGEEVVVVRDVLMTARTPAELTDDRAARGAGP